MYWQKCFCRRADTSVDRKGFDSHAERTYPLHGHAEQTYALHSAAGENCTLFGDQNRVFHT